MGKTVDIVYVGPEKTVNNCYGRFSYGEPKTVSEGVAKQLLRMDIFEKAKEVKE